MDTIKANNITIGYTRQGSGPPLVLLHGGETDHRMFNNFLPYLIDHFEVITYDQRDTGGTSNPDEPYSMLDLAADCAGLIKALGHAKASIFGVSYGGMIAQETAINHPEVLDKVILGVTTPGGKYAAENMYWIVVKLLFNRLLDIRLNPEQRQQKLAEFFLGKSYVTQHPKSIELLNSILVTRPRTKALRRGKAILKHTTADRLTNIKMPTLVLYGENDTAISTDNSKNIAKWIPGAQIQAIEDAGHGITLQQPARVAEQLKQFIFKETKEARNAELST